MWKEKGGGGGILTMLSGKNIRVIWSFNSVEVSRKRDVANNVGHPENECVANEMSCETADCFRC